MNTSDKWPEVSVVIITRGRHALAQAAVQSVLAADYPAERREATVMEETGAPEPIAGPGVSYHAIPAAGRGFGYARNQAVARAAHGIIAFMDDDCVADVRWLGEIVRPLRDDPAVSASAGAVYVPPCGLVGMCENVLGFPGGGLSYIHRAKGETMACSTFSTCNCAIRRPVLAAAGGFDESLTLGGEDEALSRAISGKGKIVFTPHAVVYHKPRDTIPGVFRWFVRRGAARREQVRRAGAGFSRMLGLILTFQSVRLALLVAAGLVAGMRWMLLPFIAGVALLYWAVTAWRRRWALEHGIPAKALLALPWVKLVMDIGMELGFAFPGWAANAIRK